VDVAGAEQEAGVRDDDVRSRRGGGKRNLLGGVLRRGVWQPQRRGRELLVLVGGTVGRGRGPDRCHARDVDDTCTGFDRAEQAQRTLDVDRPKLVQAAAFVRDEAREMENALASLGGPVERITIGEVAADDPGSLRLQWSGVGAFSNESANLIPAREQRRHEVAAEEPGCPGDERRHAVISSGRASAAAARGGRRSRRDSRRSP